MKTCLSQWRRPGFNCPAPGAERIATLVPAFRPALSLRHFRPDQWTELAAWQPSLLVGRLEQLEVVRVQPTHAIVVLTAPGYPLDEAAREGLWRRFEVPVFEQMTDGRGHVIAAECEAHDGLHLLCKPSEAPLGEIRSAPCECGRKGARVFPAGGEIQRTLTVTRSESVLPSAPVATTW